MSRVTSDEESNEETSTKQLELPANTYQIRPSVHNTFKTSLVKDIIENVLSETLTGKKYSDTESKKWIKSIADEVSTKVQELGMKRYKHIVQVMLGNQLGAGCKYLSRCRWDAESDNHTSDVFTNTTIFCVVTVFGIYHY